jgi:hypothetical protein
MLKNNISTKPPTAFSEVAARVAVASAATFLVLLAALHVVESEFDPTWRFISEYELGRYGWLMVLAFLCLAVSSASLFCAIRSQIRTVGGYVGLVCLAIGTAGFVLGAVFTTDPITANHATSHGSLHDIGAALGGFIAYAAPFLGWSLARNKAWSSAGRSLLWITSIACVGLVASVYMSALIAQSHAKFGPSVLIEWPNRILIVAIASWMLALALRSIQLRRRQNARETLQPSKSDSTYPEQRLTGS